MFDRSRILLFSYVVSLLALYTVYRDKHGVFLAIMVFNSAKVIVLNTNFHSTETKLGLDLEKLQNVHSLTSKPSYAPSCHVI